VKKYFLSPVFVVMTLSMFNFDAMASDARVIADGEFGQGTFRTRGHECFFVTAQHVVEKGGPIKLVTGGRKTFGAKLIQEFGDQFDTAVLIVESYDACKNSVWNKGTGIAKILDENQEGVLKVRNDSGGLISIRVFIRENLQDHLLIEAMNPSDTISQGYSGGTLYIGEYVVGMLLSEEEGFGNVIKQSSIDKIVSLFFEGDSYETDNVIKFTKYVQGDTSAMSGDVLAHFKGDIKLNETDGYALKLKKNSPVLLATPKMEKGTRFDLQIWSSKNKMLRQEKNLGATYKEMLFTPEDSDRYELKVIGTRNQGDYDLIVTQLAKDSELRSSSNRIQDGERIEPMIAAGAESEYRYRGSKNTPILLVSEKTSNGMSYELQLVDRSRKLIKQWKGLGTNHNELVFTPPRNNQYVLRFIGEKGYGRAGLAMQQIISDKELRKQTLKFGEQQSSIMAEGGVAEYKVRLDKGASVVFSLDKDKAAAQYDIEFLDTRFKPIKSWTKVANNFHEFSHAVEHSANFYIRITGAKDVSDYTLEVSNFSEQGQEEHNNKVVFDEFHEGELVDNQVRKYKARFKRNSPVIIRLEARQSDLRYRFDLRDPRGKKVKTMKDAGKQTQEFVFTPNYTGDYRLELEGTKSYGEFAFFVSELATDQNLKSTENIVKVNQGVFTGMIAEGAEAVYRLSSRFDKLIKLIFEPNEAGAVYEIELLTLAGKSIGHWKDLGRNAVEKEVDLPEPGVYLLKVIGKTGYGKTHVSAITDRFR